ncbi:MAG: UDP-N-acetylmuramoyl-tripeptide--D-alanyl-D-alanine ligase [Gammaproteobacteria bacterium]
MRLSEAAHTLDTTFLGKDVLFKGCSTDSRDINNEEMFIALQGEFHNGHDYIEQALLRGANAALVEQTLQNYLPMIIVDNTRKAMGKLAEHWRNRFSIPLVAITGSNGKTTVKEMLTAILSLHASVHATRGNLNNDIGLPLTLFGLDSQHVYAIVEMGANHPGEISLLSRMSHPTVALITQCAPAHLEGFGDIDGVARAKAEIFEGLDKNGIAVINADDPYAGFWREHASEAGQILFALETSADVTAKNIKHDHAGGTTAFSLITPRGRIELMLPLPGRHNVINALAAVACAVVLEVPLADIKQGLESMSAVKGRMQWKKGIRQSCVIDDTYNANPESLMAALSVLKHIPTKRWLVLGDMGELGSWAEQYHISAGQEAHDKGVERLFTIGQLGQFACESFGEGACHFETIDQLNKVIRKEVTGNLTILVKGSRAMQMERVVNALMEAD